MECTLTRTVIAMRGSGEMTELKATVSKYSPRETGTRATTRTTNGMDLGRTTGQMGE